MKRLIILGLLLGSLLFLTGCWVYGKGESVGYVYAVDDGIFWDKVWFKSNLQSSESDCYLINDDGLKDELKQIQGDTNKVRLHYKRHLFTVAQCQEGTETDDEIVSFEVVK